jgi:hypothetical protein
MSADAPEARPADGRLDGLFGDGYNSITLSSAHSAHPCSGSPGDGDKGRSRMQPSQRDSTLVVALPRMIGSVGDENNEDRK